DSSGVCFGDIDNDGDHDLFVLSNFGPNRLFESNGDGTFTDISFVSGLGGDDYTSVSCSFGDVNGDGLLDVVVANAIEDMSNLLGIAPIDPFLFNQYNQLFLGGPGNVFVDVSETSGVTDLRGFPPGFEGSPAVTWAIAMVDYDLDGDVDIVHADDQAGVPRASVGGVDRGFIHILENDGTGHFTDVTVERGMNKVGEWMGLAFGDLNEDGHFDIFGTNVGDWATTTASPLDPVYGALGVYNLGDSTSRWFLGSEDGSFSDPGVGGLAGTPFGWGASMADYDNDADTDIIYHGGMAFGPVVHSDNIGVMLLNDGAANFTYDAEALSESVDHQRRTVHGMAVGDLDDDGFTDVVSVSNFDKQASIPITQYNTEWDSPFDGLVGYQATFGPTEEPFVWAFNGYEDNDDGSLAVEISTGDNGNRWAKVELLGTVGLTIGGAVNRDGIGAVVGFRTSHGRSTLRPVTGGSSYASQDSLELVFGLGKARRGRIDVLWPGGVRNRLYGVKKRERIRFPEIPCSIDRDWGSFAQYAVCVGSSLADLRNAGYLSRQEKLRFFASAVVAYFVEQ
ncbi:MAG: CRTAC1 family protein, partial [Acidobacteriota bacterium]